MCAILFGLAMTLVLLSIRKSALPALPISIGLGVCTYALTRVALQPFIESLVGSGVYV